MIDAGKKLRAIVVRLWPAIALIGGLIALSSIAQLIGSNFVTRTVTETFIRIVLVVGLYIFVGNSGVLSYGHMAFALIGAYAVAWQTCCVMIKPSILPGLPSFLANASVPLLPAALLAGGLAMGVGFLVALVIMRLSGLAAGIATFSFLIIVNVIYSNWDSVTLGTSSIIGIPVYVTPWVALAWAAVTVAFACAYQSSKYGVMLRASREDAVAAESSGVDVTAQRIIAFTASAFFCGIGGVLYAHFLGALSVDTFYLDLTFMTLATLVVGGSGSLTGTVCGVILISFARELLRDLEIGVTVMGKAVALPNGAQQISLGIVMLLILMFLPAGLFGNWEISAPGWLRRSRSTPGQDWDVSLRG